MNPQVATAFDPALVALSFFFAVIGSLIALTAASRVNTQRGRIGVANALTIGVALGGIGVWSMHFIGMLALQMDVGSSYSMTETMLSLVVVVAAASWAVSHAAMRPDSLPRLTEGLMLLQALTVGLYLVAPTMQQVAALMANLKLGNPKMMDVAVPANMRQGLAQDDIARRGWALTAEVERPSLSAARAKLPSSTPVQNVRSTSRS